MTQYTFHTSCVESTADQINEMVDLEHELTSNQFIYGVAKRAGIVEDVLERLGYTQWGEESGRSPRALFADDFALSCHRSWFLGYPCLYVRHSAIEYVYIETVRANDVEAMQRNEKTRQAKMSELEDDWGALELHSDILDVPLTRAADRFSERNRETLLEWRIPFSAIASAGNNRPLERFLERWDADLLQ